VAKTRNAKTGRLEEPGRVGLTNPMDYAMVLPLSNYTSRPAVVAPNPRTLGDATYGLALGKKLTDSLP
jgi:hypothetical protein